ncbi:MAG: response regulator [Candidatus Omnitrophica bacterium]|nr:response regulator [Candidatus Omnitrophota bacterium]MBU4479572.1 response regulator [Candidatus Omnitrophota bacterium]MCG2704433.1 response regulator [Candidatus Omnitrophota bacterium]
MERKKIVLIDDEENFCFLVKQNLVESGRFDVEYATDPDVGIKLVKKITPDVILLDVTMPKKSGLQVLEIIKKDTNTVSIPVIMLTAVQDDKTKLKASYLFGDDYLIKPISFDVLEAKITEVIDRQARLR